MSNFKYQININNQKKKIGNWKLEIGNSWQSQVGFTLIELLVVITLMSILTLSSVSVFFYYTRSQSFQAGVDIVVADLNKAKSRAINQVKPAVLCGTSHLEGYQFWHPVDGDYYRLSVKCGGEYYVVERKNLPSGVTFASDSTNTVFFNVSSGTVDVVASVVIAGGGNSKTVAVDSVGNISVE